MKDGSGKKRESGKENGVIARGRRNEREKGRGKGSGSENGRGTGTKIVTAGPERESGSETGRKIEAATGAQTAVDQGEVYLFRIKKI